jgi:hypothetical protein
MFLLLCAVNMLAGNPPGQIPAHPENAVAARVATTAIGVACGERTDISDDAGLAKREHTAALRISFRIADDDVVE